MRSCQLNGRIPVAEALRERPHEFTNDLYMDKHSSSNYVGNTTARRDPPLEPHKAGVVDKTIGAWKKPPERESYRKV